MKLGRRVLQTLNHTLATGFALNYLVGTCDQLFPLGTDVRVIQNQVHARTLLLVRMNVRCVFQTQFQNDPVQDLSTWVQWTSIYVHGVQRTLGVEIFVENPKIIPNLDTNGSIFEEIKSNKMFPFLQFLFQTHETR